MPRSWGRGHCPSSTFSCCPNHSSFSRSKWLDGLKAADHTALKQISHQNNGEPPTPNHRICGSHFHGLKSRDTNRATGCMVSFHFPAKAASNDRKRVPSTNHHFTSNLSVDARRPFARCHLSGGQGNQLPRPPSWMRMRVCTCICIPFIFGVRIVEWVAFGSHYGKGSAPAIFEP